MANTDVITWTPAQVADWVGKQKGYESIATLFIQQDIAGKHLIRFKEVDCTGAPFSMTKGKAMDFLELVGTLSPGTPSDSSADSIDIKTLLIEIKTAVTKGSHVSVALSSTSITQANHLINFFGLIKMEMELNDLGQFENVSFTPYSWRYLIEDDAMTEAAFKHLLSLLSEAGMIGRGKFSLHDTHKAKALFVTQMGKYRVKGGVDATIVPFKVAKDDIGQIRVIIELKNPDEIKNYNQICGQAFGELLVASSCSNHPVLGLLTDLATTMYLFRVVGKQLQVFTDIPISKGYSYLVHYLKNCSKLVEFDFMHPEIGELSRELEGLKIVKSKLPEHPMVTQMNSLLDFDMPSNDNFTTAFNVIAQWGYSGMYS